MSQYYPSVRMVRFCTSLAILFGLSTVLQTAAGNFNSPTSEWNRATLQADNLPAWESASCRFSPLHPLMMFVCLSPVVSTVPQVEASPSPVDLLLEDFTALLQGAQRVEQAGVPVIQRLQEHLNASLQGVEDAQRSLWESVARDDARGVEAAVRRGAVVEKKNADLMTPLALASKECRAHAVMALLRLGASVDSTAGAPDWTPLLWARAYRRTDCETILLAAGAHLGKIGDIQKVLFEAVDRDDAEGIETAVHLGADLEAKDGEQMTALGLAAKEGRERAVATLLTLGAEVEAAAGERGWAPLIWAMANRQNQTEALLKKAGAKVGDLQKVLYEAVGRDDAEGIETAVHLGADLEAKDGEQMTALGLAAKEGRVRAVATLLTLGADLEATAGERGWSPLIWAMANRQNQTEALLRKAGAKVGDLQKILFEAVGRNDAEGIEAAVHLGADLEAKDGEQMTALGLAAKEGRERAVSTLLRLGAEVEAASGERGWSPLLWAVVNRQNQTEALLRKAGAKVTKKEAQDLLWKGVEEDDRLMIEGAFLSGADLEERRDTWPEGRPLTEASHNGRLEAVRALLRLGAGLEARDGKWLSTALHWASARGHEAVVRQLLDAGASLEAENKNGLTPLHLASSWDHLSTAKLLVEAGADINHRTSSGKTPLFEAEFWNNPAVAAYLRSVGATT